MSRLSRTVLALLLTAAVSCSDDATSLFLRVEGADEATQLELRGVRDGEPWFGPERRPEQEGTPFSGEQTLRLRFNSPPDVPFELQVDALQGGDPIARTSVEVTLRKGEEMELRLQLTKEPPPDGGTPDGGEPDAGAPDAGVMDGGTDGGSPDGGEPDAGAPDAGTGVCTTCVQPGGACVPVTSARACGGSGVACVDCVADGRANQCTAGGACSCGSRGTPCDEGERCQGDICVCDPDTCAGCCEGNACRNGNTMTACGINGATCTACNASKADNCATGGCRCGTSPACTGLLSCRSGSCSL
ncbi:hypothetical protein JY651_36035 [Pyxidicoccus parkwayensis]|uniref:Lipoprotein n=1 Tax=Pyxidicoccus parkwayensis TaxID=2813578 RepID=A0ABX7NP21_9BACT|nr:hypothetical protein [Pyxidicoccus parkwaysis]QSQ20610.1 hypothetical protein JY651_36035 [Pyxidicoccus parkwaysis]